MISNHSFGVVLEGVFGGAFICCNKTYVYNLSFGENDTVSFVPLELGKDNIVNSSDLDDATKDTIVEEIIQDYVDFEDDDSNEDIIPFESNSNRLLN